MKIAGAISTPFEVIDPGVRNMQKDTMNIKGEKRSLNWARR